MMKPRLSWELHLELITVHDHAILYQSICYAYSILILCCFFFNMIFSSSLISRFSLTKSIINFQCYAHVYLCPCVKQNNWILPWKNRNINWNESNIFFIFFSYFPFHSCTLLCTFSILYLYKKKKKYLNWSLMCMRLYW